jgi:arylsulfatase
VDHLVGVNSPLYEGRSFSVTAEAEITTGKEEGVLFAIGGEKAGISLFIKDGKVQYAHKANNQLAYLISKTPIIKGKLIVKLEYNFTGLTEATNSVGSEILYINGEKIAERAIPKGQATITAGNRIDGTDVGRDLRTPVSDQYSSPFDFTGKLKKVTIQYQ